MEVFVGSGSMFNATVACEEVRLRFVMIVLIRMFVQADTKGRTSLGISEEQNLGVDFFYVW